jgi:hypothetical protein
MSVQSGHSLVWKKLNEAEAPCFCRNPCRFSSWIFFYVWSTYFVTSSVHCCSILGLNCVFFSAKSLVLDYIPHWYIYIHIYIYVIIYIYTFDFPINILLVLRPINHPNYTTVGYTSIRNCYSINITILIPIILTCSWSTPIVAGYCNPMYTLLVKEKEPRLFKSTTISSNFA